MFFHNPHVIYDGPHLLMEIVFGSTTFQCNSSLLFSPKYDCNQNSKILSFCISFTVKPEKFSDSPL